MPLTLVLGPANSAKAGEVLGAFADQRRRDALLVVPTSADAQLYGRELAAQGAVLGGAVVTFAGLAREIARRAGYEARLASPLQRERLLRRAIQRLSLRALRESATTPGFAAAALELIAELERSLITPERFAQVERGEAALIYTAYARELERAGRVDAELYAWRALDALRASPGCWGATPVFFYGFDDLTPLERDAIETLARVAGADLTVSLTYEPGRVALMARAEAVEELRPLAERVVELPATDDHYRSSAIHVLERQIFGEGTERIDPGDAIKLLESGGERAEVELVAAEVLGLRREGIPADQIAVVYRSLAGVAGLIDRVFGAYRIPIALDRRIPFEHTALGRGLLGLARCALLPDARATDLIAYLRTPGVYERADEAEAIVQREGLRTAAEARERLGLTLREMDSLDLDYQARRLLALPHRGSAALLSSDEQLDARAAAVLLGALSELEDLGERPAGPELVELLEGLEVRAGGRVRTGAVVVAEPLQIRARRFQAVLVCGLQEGAFPMRGAPDPFIGDEYRRELALTGLRLRPREDALARERYLFYSCVSRPTERLVLSYRSSDEEGNIELPSPFVADVAELLIPKWFDRRRRRLLVDVVWPLAEAPTACERARSEAAARGAVEGDARERKLGQAALNRIRHSQILSAGALEKYADCPVKWLVERELRPARFEPENEPLVRGKLVHDLLERLLRQLGQAVTPASLPNAQRILDELLKEVAPTLARGRPASVREAALRSVEADLRRYLEYEAAAGPGWSPNALELRFGFEDEQGEALPALELDGDVRVRGMIDRLDVDGEGRAIVRDYKTGGGRAQYPVARWSEDRQLQVALYMLAVRELLGLEPVAGFYQPLGGDDLRARGLFVSGTPVGAGVVGTDSRSTEELQEVLDDARARALALASRLRSGNIIPSPETCSRDGCCYPGICRSV